MPATRPTARATSRMAARTLPTGRRRLELALRTARRTISRYGVHPLGAVRRIDERMVFVVGSPRSGTSFTASSLGEIAGFADLGEVNLIKASAAAYAREAQHDRPTVVRSLRRTLRRAQRTSLVAGRRCIEQTPEASFLVAELASAFPESVFVHLVRDGRDVVCSLLERGWLAGDAGEQTVARGAGNVIDDAGNPFGGYARFWVEAGREPAFESASEARRCAWAWRRYHGAAAEAAASLPADRLITVRYEALVGDSDPEARRLGERLVDGAAVDGVAAPERVEQLVAALGRAHGRSVGRWQHDLEPGQLDDVMDEAGATLRELGYV